MKILKRRYLAVQVDSAKPINSNELMNAIWNAITDLHGESGASQTGLSLIGYEDQTKFAVLRVGHKSLEMLRASLASITSIAGKPAAIHVLRVSGTIKALRNKTKVSL